MKSLNSRWEAVFQKNYATPKINLVSGKGISVSDEFGKKYLDFIGGIATNVLGHSHPAIVKAVSNQVKKLGHVSNLYANPISIELATKLIELSGRSDAKVFFCNSGAEANEAALKLSRKTGRSRVVSTIGSFHGRTMGALSITGQSTKRDNFKPILRGVKHVQFGDVKALKSAVNRKTAMLIIEPIQGENGVIVPPAGYLRAAREICDANGALLVLDCVQTGMGRTGTFFGFEDEEISPDVITLAKGLGGGLPIGAMIAIGPAAHLFKPGDHGSTFGGNPIAAAAGLAVIAEIKRAKLPSNALKMSKLLTKQLSKISGVSEVRGKGLLIGIGLTNPVANEISNKLLEKGVLVNAPNPNTIRIAPALILNSSEVEKFVKIFNEVMNG
ncbi:MAG: hypothetical protein RLZ57_1201 [Actinomycetota bacterium]|jgi:acetylornithine aminotransferase